MSSYPERQMANWLTLSFIQFKFPYKYLLQLFAKFAIFNWLYQ
jgi:hypothetical protein